MGRKHGDHQSKLARAAIDQNPELPNRTIARLLRTEHPAHFASIEAARAVVRYCRGNRGETSRQVTTNKSRQKPNGKAGEVLLPKGRKQSRDPVRIPAGKTLVLSDIHSPYHDHRALEAAVKKGRELGCDQLYLNGDTADFYAISRWQTDPSERDFPKEIETTKQVLGYLASQPFGRRWFKVGNHDARWDLFLWNRAEELVGLKEFELTKVLGLDEFGYEFVRSKQWANFGALSVFHGHEIQGLSSPVNPARGLYLKITETSACGHLHRTSHHSETHPLKKSIVSCWSGGCLCDLRPEFAIINKWNLGFMVITHDARSFEVENYRIDSRTYEVWR